MTAWNEAQSWESEWWGDCLNTFGEEEKQILYANRMGLHFHHNKKSPYNIDVEGASILDIGGGPASLLLKCVNRSRATVLDPLVIPDWVKERYKFAGIEFLQMRAEEFPYASNEYDEVWIYNCLQHVIDPGKIIDGARRCGKIIRVFEWLDTEVNIGHPFSFANGYLDLQLGGVGKVEQLTGQSHCFGKCYYGIFIGERFHPGNT